MCKPVLMFFHVSSIYRQFILFGGKSVCPPKIQNVQFPPKCANHYYSIIFHCILIIVFYCYYFSCFIYCRQNILVWVKKMCMSSKICSVKQLLQNVPNSSKICDSFWSKYRNRFPLQFGTSGLSQITSTLGILRTQIIWVFGRFPQRGVIFFLPGMHFLK